MPCKSDYLNPSNYEKDCKEIASHIVFISDKLNIEVEEKYREASEDIYGRTSEGPLDINAATIHLCSLIKDMDQPQLNSVVYNARDKRSRKLADWWETHVEADKKRLLEEVEKEKTQVRQIFGKFSQDEIKILHKHHHLLKKLIEESIGEKND